jgi:hypothetical protein
MTVACTAITASAPINVICALAHDETWWAEEAARCRSDWKGVVETRLAALALLGQVERGASR